MMSRPWLNTSLALLCCIGLSFAKANAQSPSALYTWPGTGNTAAWVVNFADVGQSALLSNAVAGELTLAETGTAGESIAFSDGANRVRETPSAGSGGTDVTGLDFLEFDLGHNGAGNINVQFYVQASTGFNFVALGPDLPVTPGVNTYQVPITGLTPAQAVYLRTIGFNARDHLAVGNVTWTLQEVRAGGTPLTTRTLITHAAGTGDGGLQGAIVNFDAAAVLGNDGGQNQTGLSWNSAGTGSLQWTDVGGSQGAAMSWGNGTAWGGNTFNNREADLSNYNYVIFRVSATDPLNGGGTLGVGSFFQTNNFQFNGAEGGASRNLPIDGEFHDLVWSLAGLPNQTSVDLTGLNLFAHAQNLVINVDSITFVTEIPEPTSLVLLGIALFGYLGSIRWTR